MDKLIDKYVTIQNRSGIVQGLFIAQLIAQKRFFDAFDKGGTEVVSLIMEDLSNAMEEITNATDKDLHGIDMDFFEKALKVA